LGILGCAVIKGSDGVHDEGEGPGAGNYHLRDQRRALEWVHHFIADFGGDAGNVTIFGEGTGAADVLCHLVSRANAASPLVHRAIVQSPLFEAHVPTTAQAVAQMSRTLSTLGVSSAPELRKVDVEKLVLHPPQYRVVDDGVWFREGWKEILGFTDPTPHPASHAHQHLPVSDPCAYPPSRVLLEHNGQTRPLTPGTSKKAARAHSHSHSHSPHSRSHSRSRSPAAPSLPPIIIGDCGFESFQFAAPASMWTVHTVHRRIKAIVHNLHRANALFNAYDVSAQTPDDELPDRLLELINDTRFAWPTHRVARALAHSGAARVWRYVFDQEAPKRGVPHHAADLLYLFDNARPSGNVAEEDTEEVLDFYPESYSDGDDSDGDGGGFDNSAFGAGGDEAWDTPVVDLRMYERVRDAMQGRWLAFAHGTPAPWGTDSVYVFGPEGETGERRVDIFAGRRRTAVWTNVLEPLGRDVVLKIGFELSNGPPGYNAA
jgi:hypothetical protein